MKMQKTLFLAGIPAVQKNLYHRIQFSVGDPAAWIQFEKVDGKRQSFLVCRDIEMERARKKATVMLFIAQLISLRKQAFQGIVKQPQLKPLPNV